MTKILLTRLRLVVNEGKSNALVVDLITPILRACFDEERTSFQPLPEGGHLKEEDAIRIVTLMWLAQCLASSGSTAAQGRQADS